MVWGSCTCVLVYCTGIVRNELICGYAKVVHTSSSYRTHTHTHTHSYHLRTANQRGKKWTGHCRKQIESATVETFYVVRASNIKYKQNRYNDHQFASITFSAWIQSLQSRHKTLFCWENLHLAREFLEEGKSLAAIKSLKRELNTHQTVYIKW